MTTERRAPAWLGDIDLYLLGEGKHRRLFEKLGAHRMSHDGSDGVSFAVWAPATRSVSVVGDFNSWNGRVNPMRVLGTSGVWQTFVPGIEDGQNYKFEIVNAEGHLTLKTDPFAFATEVPPDTASKIYTPSYEFGDGDWMTQRAAAHPYSSPMSVYEVHLGSWRRDGNASLGYREAGEQLARYCTEMGFTHVEFLPLAEHPFGGSWGYQVSRLLCSHGPLRHAARLHVLRRSCCIKRASA